MARASSGSHHQPHSPRHYCAMLQAINQASKQASCRAVSIHTRGTRVAGLLAATSGVRGQQTQPFTGLAA
eukprot:352498-Lingulodinium_polyedra.AAC.1